METGCLELISKVAHIHNSRCLWSHSIHITRMKLFVHLFSIDFSICREKSFRSHEIAVAVCFMSSKCWLGARKLHLHKSRPPEMSAKYRMVHVRLCKCFVFIKWMLWLACKSPHTRPSARHTEIATELVAAISIIYLTAVIFINFSIQVQNWNRRAKPNRWQP